MRQSLIALVVVVAIAASVPTLVVPGAISNNQQESVVATSAAYSYSRNSAGGLIEQVNRTSGMLEGCNTLATSVLSQGYGLKIYLSSYSPERSDSLCITAIFHDFTATPLTLGEGLDLGVSIIVTDSNGHTVMSTACRPSIPIPINGTNPSPPQGIQCGTLWDTMAPVNGIAPQPGTYHVSAVGSLIDPQNQTIPHISITSGANVTLSG
jgi:hypothetical protein